MVWKINKKTINNYRNNDKNDVIKYLLKNIMAVTKDEKRRKSFTYHLSIT